MRFAEAHGDSSSETWPNTVSISGNQNLLSGKNVISPFTDPWVQGLRNRMTFRIGLPYRLNFGGYLIPVAGHVLLKVLFVPSNIPPLIFPRKCP